MKQNTQQQSESSIEEVRNDYTDDENYTHIDVWETGNEQGKSVAIVDMDNGKIFFIDNSYRNNEMVQEAIKELKPINNYPKLKDSNRGLQKHLNELLSEIRVNGVDGQYLDEIIERAETAINNAKSIQ